MSLGHDKVELKYSEWEWKIDNSFNLNISFIDFELKYSGEKYLQERVTITSAGDITVGKYCGRRYYWSVFASPAPITLYFYTYDSSRAYFLLHYQLSDCIMTNSMLMQKHHNVIGIITSNSSFLTCSVIQKYTLMNDNYYSWNILALKRHKLSIQSTRDTASKGILYLYDGPDFHNHQYDMTTMKTFTSSTFQVSVLFQDFYNNIEMKFKSLIFVEGIQNYKKYTVKDKLEWSSRNLKCAKESVVLCAFNIHVPRYFYINVTLLSLIYNGPDVGHCKYGGLSVYDYVRNTMKEVVQTCNSMFPLSSNYLHSRVVISNKNNIFLIFYSYLPYSEIDMEMIIEPTTCQGVHVQR